MKHALLLFLLLPTLLAGQTAGHMSLNLTSGVEISEIQQMYWSNVVCTGTGTLLMNPNGERSSTGNVTFKDEYHSPGRFQVTGAPTSTFKITFTDVTNLSNGKFNLTVSELKTSLVNNIGTTDANGKCIFSVACKISIPNGVTSGVYLSTFNITASYE